LAAKPLLGKKKSPAFFFRHFLFYNSSGLFLPKEALLDGIFFDKKKPGA
jgi:hypothetical protein